MALNANILLYDEPRKRNTKASEEYVHVRFSYPDVHKKWDGWVPVEYRRTGVSIPVEDHQALEEHLNHIYAQMHPSLYPEWVAEQDELWNATRSVETKEIFNILKDGRWHCRNCEISNPNFARRIQDIKEMGYTVATHINYHCPVCGNRRSTRLRSFCPSIGWSLREMVMKPGLQPFVIGSSACLGALMSMRTPLAGTAYLTISSRKSDGMTRPSLKILRPCLMMRSEISFSC